MRSRYAASTGYPDLSVDQPGRLGTEPGGGGQQQACYEKTSIALAVRQLGAVALWKKYHDKAKAVSAAQGCANCWGVELLRSCLQARGALILQDVEVDLDGSLVPLVARYCANLVGLDFGEGPQKYYRTGIMVKAGPEAEDAPANPIAGRWYAGLRQNVGYLADDKRYLGVTKQSANAHAVISRKTLEIGFRYALCEYLAAVPSPGFRDAGRIVVQSVGLAGDGSADPGRIMTRWEELRNDFKDVLTGHGTPTGIEQIEVVRRLLDALARDLGATWDDDELSWEHKKAMLSGWCTLYRLLALSISVRPRRLAPDVQAFMSSVLPLISCANDEGNQSVASFDITNIIEGLRKLSSLGDAGAAVQVINKIGLKWQNVADVEFGHQCGMCEDRQGDADLSRRFVDHAELNEGAVVPHPNVGLTFGDLSLSPDSDTVWDVTNAVTCRALEFFFAEVCKERVRNQPEKQADFMTSMAYHCNQTAPFFIAYLEVLMLELSYCNREDQPRRITKLLRTA